MKKFIFMCLVDMKRSVLTGKWLLVTLALTLCEFLTIVNEIKWGGNVYYYYGIISYMGFGLIYLLFAVVPGTNLFCADRENQYIRFVVLRSSKKTYGISKVISSFLSAFSVVFVAEMIFVMIMHVWYPLLPQGNNLNARGPLLTAFPNGIAYFLARVSLRGACAGFFAVVSLWIASRLTNLFVIYAMPLICFYLFDNIASILSLPNWLNIRSVSEGSFLLSFGHNPNWLIYGFVFFIVISTFVAIDFVFACKGKVENE